ncbi:MAG: DegV family protein [Clostridia bacterium]|nr:DegV family protein [Clostridia bacterium]
MRKVKIITDSCADLTAEQLSRYDIDYAKMSTVYNGVESPALLTWSDEEAHVLYNIMRDGNRITTAQVSVEEFQRIFYEYLKQDMDIVYIGCSSKSSGSVNTGFVIAKKLMEAYPESKIICIDSLNASMGEGMLAIEAAKMANEGATATEIEKHILSVRKKVNQYVTVHSLDALKRAGRVKGSAAFFGNLMGVKPIIIADANGDQAAYKKVKGRQKSFEEIVYAEGFYCGSRESGDLFYPRGLFGGRG